MAGRIRRWSALVVAAVLAFETDANAAPEGAAAESALTWPDAPPPPVPAPRISAPMRSDKERIENVLRNDPEIGHRYRQGRGMIIGGAVSLGASGVSLATAGIFALSAEFSLADSDEEESQAAVRKDERNTAVGFAIAAGTFVAIGLPLVIIGAHRRSGAIADAKRRLSIGMGPRGFGLRF